MAALTTWCRLMRVGPTCAIPCGDCRATSGELARAGITIDPDRFYDAPPTSEETAMPACPKTDVLATREEILDGCETFYGAPIAEIGEEGHAIVAAGHFEPRRYLAAMLAFARSRGWAPFELRLDDLSVEAAEKTKRWLLIYRHADAVTTDTANGEDWCVCDDCRWWAVQSAEGASGATAVMWWEI